MHYVFYESVSRKHCMALCSSHLTSCWLRRESTMGVIYLKFRAVFVTNEYFKNLSPLTIVNNIDVDVMLDDSLQQYWHLM